MWSLVLLVYDIIKLIISLIIKSIKIWWSAMQWCFAFFVTSINELKTLSWNDENDKGKIIKNYCIIGGAVLGAILLIWLLIHTLSGGFMRSNTKNATTVAMNNNAQVVETTSKMESTVEETKIEETTVNETVTQEKKVGWDSDPNDSSKIIYYDENSNKVVNKDYKIDGNWYYFDDNGFMIKNKWNGDYYYGADGKMVTNQWVDKHYVGSDGAMLKDTVTPDGKGVDKYGNVFENDPNSWIGEDSGYTETMPIGTTTVQTQEATVVSETNPSVETTVAAENVEELYIRNVEKTKDSFEYWWTSSNEAYTVEGCDISISKPIVSGVNKEEVDNVNNQLTDLVQQLDDRIKDEDLLVSNDRAITSINLNKSTIKYTNDVVTIIISGQLTYTSSFVDNYSWPIEFTIEYDRHEKYSKMHNKAYSELKIPSDEIFYAE